LKQQYSILLAFITSLAFAATYAQGESSIWYFGNKAGISFSGNTVSAVTNGQLNSIEGCTTIADALGNLRFYTNGVTVWNKNHFVMANGTGLFADPSSSQAAVIVPKPGDANIYYIFTTNPFEANAGLRYSIVDMSLAGGNGAVTTKNALIYDGTCEKISVVKHANGQDYWVVTHHYGSNGFQANLVSPSGLSPTVVNSNSGATVVEDFDPTNAIGYMKLSPDGTKLAICHTYMAAAGQNTAELFDFDAATGVITNPRALFTDMHPYGVEFSGEGNTLFISCYDEKKIFEFNLEAGDIPASKVLVAQTAYHPAAMQLGPNGKIYVAMAEHDKLSVITHPSVYGDGCAIQADAVDLAGRMCFLGLPSFSQSQFDMKISYSGLCSGYGTQFSFDTPFNATTYLWDFGDDTTSTDATPTHHYAVAGTYTVTATIATTSGPVSRSTTMDILPSGVAHTVPDQALCIDGDAIYTLSENNAAVLGDQSPSVFGVAYFASAADAQNNVNELPDHYHLDFGTVTVFAKIYNLANHGCYNLTSFEVTCYRQPVVVRLVEYIACDTGAADGFTAFDLPANDGEILGTQPDGNYTVGYYRTEEDALMSHEPIEGTFYNTANPQIIFVRIENVEGGCSVVLPLMLVVKRCNPEPWDYPKFFTPNGDGFNDHWEVKSLPDRAVLSVAIFDRYGKLLTTIAPGDGGWDGTIAGNALPSTDYWFIATGSHGQQLRGHFSLKR
jgi:gliding motility-associated-like protein